KLETVSLKIAAAQRVRRVNLIVHEQDPRFRHRAGVFRQNWVGQRANESRKSAVAFEERPSLIRTTEVGAFNVAWSITGHYCRGLSGEGQWISRFRSLFCSGWSAWFTSCCQ